MPIQLVAIDVDGTLINDHYEIPERNKVAIQKLQEKGTRIVLATGRGPRSCYPLIEELQLEDPIITHNGAVVLDPKSKEISLEIGFQAKELLPVLHFCREEGIHYDLNTAFDMYIENMPEGAAEMYKKFFVEPQLISDMSLLQEQVVKFTLFSEQERLDYAMDKVEALFPDWSVIRSGEKFIDIIHPQATKGYALSHLLKIYDIQPENVMAFGNYFNDLEMLQLAGTGIAMENSPDQVKELADRVTSSNNESGVALILEEILDANIQIR